MFKLKYPASTSSPSLSTSTSTPTSPSLPSRSSSNALSALQQQRQQQHSRNNNTSPILTARARTTSLLPVSPRRPAPPSTSSPKTARKTKKSSKTPSVEVVDDIASAAGDVTMPDKSMEIERLPSSLSRQSVTIPEEEGEEDWGGNPVSQNVVVCVRVRPGGNDCKEELWAMDAERNRIIPTDQHPTIAKRNNSISTPSNPNTSMLSTLANSADSNENGAYDFRFDSLVLPSMNTSAMYEANISPIIDAVVGGYNGTVFAYGQTGSGKTHTMSGSDTEKGVIPRAVEEIFEKVEKDSQREFLLRVSYLEIYNETLKDLLAPYPNSSSTTDLTARPSSPIKGGSSHVAGGNDSGTLRILESGGRIQIQGLREEIVTNAAEVLNLLEWGQRGRHQAATDWNERSSRSHCVFILTVESREQNGPSSDVRFSQLNLIDLAGSERAASEKERRKEGAFINKSLLTLGTVIAKLSEQSQTGNEDAHIPYRDSKLTRLLQTSLGGNARVAVVCTLSPRKEHGVESLSTLRFGQRCKMVITKAKRGTIMNDKALIARYRKELERLRSQLEQGNATMGDMSIMPIIDDASMKELQSKREEAEKDVKSMNEKRDELKKQVEHLTKLILTGKNVAADDGQYGDSSFSMTDRRARRAGRMSDLGTSSPSKRQKVFNDSSFDQENISMIPSGKPFALESELAALRKNLAAAMAGRQASEEARVQETQLWKTRVMELEAANTEQEEELDEAEVAFEKLKNDRDVLRMKVEEEKEANRLLKLVAKSRGADVDESQRMLLEHSQREVERLQQEMQVEIQKREEAKKERNEELTTLKKQLATMQERLEEERSKSEQLLVLQKELDMLKTSSDSSELMEKFENVKEQLHLALEEKEQAQKELKAVNLERGQEDAERDFADLVKGEGSTDKETAILEKKLKESRGEVEELKRELNEAKQKTKPLPVPSLSSSPSLSDNLRSVLEKQLKVTEERSKALEDQVKNLKVEAQKNLAAKSESERQALRIASLEKQLFEASKVKVPGSPLKSSFGVNGSLLDDEPVRKSGFGGGARSSLQRGGSMREYKRYSATNDLPSSNNVALEQAIKAEREEIERLNEVIVSQRGIMSDLEGSVAAWKSRLRLQHDIITRLVEAGGVDKITLPEELIGTPTLSRHDGAKKSSSSLAPIQPNSPTPYYGAHTYNRAPTGLGLGSTSPTKGVAWLSTMPGVKPDPLPLPNGLSSPNSRAKRRKTIEHEIEELKGSPRVKSTTDRLLETKTSRPLPIPGSPAKLRPSKDYYI